MAKTSRATRNVRKFINTQNGKPPRVKSDYHSNRHDLSSNIHKTRATELAKQIHGTKRKPKDFTK